MLPHLEDTELVGHTIWLKPWRHLWFVKFIVVYTIHINAKFFVRIDQKELTNNSVAKNDINIHKSEFLHRVQLLFLNRGK